MPFEAKIAAFWSAVWISSWLLRRHPESVIAKMAFSWFGPIPLAGEKQSAFYCRNGYFALGWLVKISLLASIVFLVADAVPAIRKAESVLWVVSFFLMIGFGMAALGACLAFLWAAKSFLFGQDPECRLASDVRRDRMKVLKRAERREAAMAYAVVIEKAGNDFSAFVPDLPGCVATGATLEQVEIEIREAIEIHIEGMLEDGLPVPMPAN